MHGFHHVAFAYDELGSAAERVAADISRDRQQGTATLVCLPDPLVAKVAERVDMEGVQQLPVGVRYARPIDAMRELWRFASTTLQTSARVHSIGQIDFDGTDADRDWHWYEHAANDIFRDVALSATCMLDLTRIPRETMRWARLTHHEMDGCLAAVDDDPSLTLTGPCPLPLPERLPDVVMTGITAPRPARSQVRSMSLRTDVEERAQLVVSEIVTNAILHGSGQADLRLWNLDGGLFVEISDDGPGVHDPIVALRPPALPARGAGIWASHMAATRLHVGSRTPHGAVITALID